MHVLWFEFTLALRRLVRRRTQNGLMLVTFAVSVTLALLSWSLYYTVNLIRPDFDPHGEYYVLAYDGSLAVDSSKSTHEEMEAYKAQQTAFADMVELGFYDSSSVKTPDGYERALGAWMSSRALQLTGAKPLLGTLFSVADDAFHAPEKVLLSERLWTVGFGRDPDIVGKPIEIGGDPGTIVGVLPASYRFPNDQDYWISYGAAYNNTRWPVRAALVKLKPGVSKARAESDLRAIQASLPATSPSKIRGARVALLNFRDLYLLPDMRMSAMILLALALLFVAVSCANAANLMIIDFLGRRPEVAATLALGIPRRAAIRNVCWQVGLLALGATVVALALLPVAGPLMFDRIKVIMAPYWLVYHFAWRDVGVALLLAGVVAGVTVSAPIAYLLLVDPDKVIRDQASAGRGTGRGLWRRLLLIGQIALLTVLGVCAGLLVRSNRNVGESHWGYEATRVFNGKITVDAINYPGKNWSVGRLASLRQAFQAIRRRPETAFAAYADQPPGYSNGPYCTYAADPQALTNGLAQGEAFYSRISDQFFSTLEVPFVAGEDFPADPPDGGLPDAILTQSLASRLWPHEDPVHRTLYARYPWMKAGEPPMQLVVRGVVRDFQANGPRARTNDAIFLPFRKLDGAGTTLHIFVRDQSGLASFKSISDAVHRGEMRASLYFPSTVKRQIDLMLSSMRMTADLTTVFALAAVMLCAIGVYSLTVAQVLQTVREFGIRMALGAEPGRLWRDFTRGHMLTALIGVGLGSAGAWQAVRVLGALLYGVDPHSVGTYAGVSAAILVVAALACVPSLFQLRRINPADCLRTL
ncbi:MAG: ABC transporter permease [Opitutales bacterium]